MGDDIGPEIRTGPSENRPAPVHEAATPPKPEIKLATATKDTHTKDEELEKVRKGIATANKPQATATPYPTITSAAQEELYGDKYAGIAESRYGKGLLINHGKKAIQAMENISKNATILEVGCNTGMLMQQLRENGFNEIKGVDINKAAVATAKERGNNVLIGSAEHLPVKDGSIEAIVSLHTYEHIPDIKAATAEIYRALKPGGKAIIVEPPNFSGLETIRVAIEDLPESKKGEGLFGKIKTLINGLKSARQLHCSTLGWGIWGAKEHAEKILKENQIDLKVSGGMRIDMGLANLLVLEKPLS